MRAEVVHIALYQPEIAGNAGSVARTCLAIGARLHLIRPLGFRLGDAALRRAGLDYWPEVALTLHDSYAHFRTAFAAAFNHRRVFAFTTKGTTLYTEVTYQAADVLLFGPESRGLPEAVRAEAIAVRIPMNQGRSLNLAVSVGIGAYEAWRQLGFQG